MKGWSTGGKLGLVALANCITNPLVNVLYRLGRLWGWPRGPVVVSTPTVCLYSGWPGVLEPN